MPRLGLCMLVSDEDHDVERALCSARPLIDTYIICHTGSNDDIIERVSRTLHDIPGTVHSRPWKDFGANLTELMKLARGRADHLLLLDADMTIETESPLPALNGHTAYYADLDEDFRSRVPRIVDGHHRWYWRGSARSVMTSDHPYHEEFLTGLRAVRQRGGDHPGVSELERDHGLLMGDLRQCPEDPHTLFALAMVELRMGRRMAALLRLRSRVRMEGDADENYIALLRLAELEGVRGSGSGTTLARWAIEHHPDRAEAFVVLAEVLMSMGCSRAALTYARMSSSLTLPTRARLVHPSAYGWQGALTHLRAAVRTKSWDEAFRIGERIQRDSMAPMKALTEMHSHFEAMLCRPCDGDVLTPMLRDVVDVSNRWRLDVETHPVTAVMNPTIHATDGSLTVIARLTNGCNAGDGYVFLDGEAKFRSTALLLNLTFGGGGLQVRNHRMIRDVGETLATVGSTGIGIEDCRLIEVNGQLMALGTSSDLAPTCIAAPVLVDLADDSALALPVPTPGRPEKNWIPLVIDGALCVILSVDPLVVFRIESDGALTRLVARPLVGLGPMWRGGSQGLPVEGGWLVVVHRKEYSAEEVKRYTHRFVLIGWDLKLTACSPEFTIDNAPVEMVCGLAHRNRSLFLSAGLLDQSAVILETSLDEVLAQLEPIRPTKDSATRVQWDAVLRARGAPPRRVEAIPQIQAGNPRELPHQEITHVGISIF